MNQKNKFLIGLSILLCFAFAFSGCGSKKQDGNSDNIKNPSTSGMSDVKYSSGKNCTLDYSLYTDICANDSVALSLNKLDGSLCIKNLNNNFSWYSGYDLVTNNVAKQLNEKWRFNLNSLLLINYFDNENNTGVDSQTNAFAENAKIRTETRKDGIDIYYIYQKLSISFKVEIRLYDDGFEIGVPAKSIREYGKFKLTKISLLPFFGGSPSTNDGYLFYPDGSGALCYFDSKDTMQPAQNLTLQTYGTENLNVAELVNERYLGRKQAMLPVFGLKNGDNAFLAAITEGDADSSINVSTSSLIVDLNNIYASFCYRRQIDITSVNNSINANADAKSYQFESKMTGSNIKVRYFLLSGDTADYSGMASVYRDYISKAGLLNKVDCTDLPLSLLIFMGAYEDRALFSKYQTVTTYKQTSDILSEITAKSEIPAVNITLNGWNKGGYRAGVMPIGFNKNYGTKKEFAAITNYLKTSSAEVYLNQQYTYFDSRYCSFSKGKDVAYQATGLVAADDNLYLPNVTALFRKYINKFANYAQKYDFGISFSGPGSQLYCDYNAKAPSSRTESKKYIANELLKLSGKKVSLISEGNAYMLPYLKGIINVPEEDSGYPITDRCIPFYQMIVHGSLPYTGTQPGNLSANFEKLKLKWIEYGFSPDFEVTADSSSKLKYTDYNELYSSRYDSWKEKIVLVSAELNALGVSGAKIVRHECISDNVYQVTYDNGTVITVNYNNTDVAVNGTTIAAEGYAIVRKGA